MAPFSPTTPGVEIPAPGISATAESADHLGLGAGVAPGRPSAPQAFPCPQSALHAHGPGSEFCGLPPALRDPNFSLQGGALPSGRINRRASESEPRQEPSFPHWLPFRCIQPTLTFRRLRNHRLGFQMMSRRRLWLQSLGERMRSEPSAWSLERTSDLWPEPCRTLWRQLRAASVSTTEQTDRVPPAQSTRLPRGAGVGSAWLGGLESPSKYSTQRYTVKVCGAVLGAGPFWGLSSGFLGRRPASLAN